MKLSTEQLYRFRALAAELQLAEMSVRTAQAAVIVAKSAMEQFAREVGLPPAGQIVRDGPDAGTVLDPNGEPTGG